MNQSQLPATGPAEDDAQVEPAGTPESPTIGALLKSLRGKRILTPGAG